MKKEYNSNLLNIILLISFVTIVGGVLYYRNKNKEKNKIEKSNLEKQAKEEIYKKVHQVNEERYREGGNLITTIPKFEENAFEETMRNLDTMKINDMKESNIQSSTKLSHLDIVDNLHNTVNMNKQNDNNTFAQMALAHNHSNVMIDNMPNINNVNLQSNQPQLPKMIYNEPLQPINF